MNAPADLVTLLAASFPGTRVLRCELMKKGLRADAYSLSVSFGSVERACIAKHFRQRDEFGANECASYRLLAAAGSSVAPEMFVTSDDDTWLVIEAYDALDLIGALRAGKDPAAITAQLAATLSQLVTSTAPVEHDDARTRRAEAARLAAQWPRVRRWAGTLGVPTDSTVDRIVDDLISRYADPPVVAWTQGDPAPSNVLFTGERAVLVDFEYGAYRHALHDLVQWRIRCPLPPEWCVRLEESVGSALTAAHLYPDVAAFREDLSAMAAYAALYMFSWLPIERAIDEDLPWAPGFPARAALLSTSQRLNGPSGERSPALCDWSGQLHRALARRWPERGSGTIDWEHI